MAEVKTTTGLKKETAGALAYVLGPLTGVLFFVLEKDPRNAINSYLCGAFCNPMDAWFNNNFSNFNTFGWNCLLYSLAYVYI